VKGGGGTPPLNLPLKRGGRKKGEGERKRKEK